MRPILSFRRSSAALAAASLFTLIGCRGDSVTAPGGESEVISRVTLSLTPAGGSAASAYIEDADGNGPGAPSAQVGTLSVTRGVTYTGSVRFENRLVTPIENITDEVIAEGAEHRVLYTVSGEGITVTTTDLDNTGKPLGVNFTLAAGASATSGPRNMRVVLCHYGTTTKPATATSCTVDTDIDVTFALTVP
jgi:hypothetical protein